ncbi:hypothetical protein [Bifidobacterium mongoliense]|uniref:Uncharacterized protein n=1 Tax=Bifidobacterium mongoliense DSM 21395 TaxID=1437603 RepID=A0A087BZV3_9BIFI|nr:hypothetical protein [Bifidobacterium mongoliense]KFI76553.1 hypothetical protein BMON_1149 [Bifidobacterium mongoliense DSM 21395]
MSADWKYAKLAKAASSFGGPKQFVAVLIGVGAAGMAVIETGAIWIKHQLSKPKDPPEADDTEEAES